MMFIYCRDWPSMRIRDEWDVQDALLLSKYFNNYLS